MNMNENSPFLQAFMDAGEHRRDIARRLLDFRSKITLATITILTVATPFADRYVHFPCLFKIAYALLAISTISGLIAVELILQSDIRNFDNAQTCLKNAQEKFKDNDMQAAISEFNKAKDNSCYSSFPSGLSKWAMYFFVVGLALLIISVFPQ